MRAVIVSQSVGAEREAPALAQPGWLRSPLPVVALLLVAAGLRWWGLGQRGLIEWDGAYYLGVVKTVLAGLEWFWNALLHVGPAVPLDQQ